MNALGGRRVSAARRIAALAAFAIAALGSSGQAAQAGQLTLGFGDPAFSGAGRDAALDLSVQADARVVRLAVGWSRVAPQRPADPANPADPAYRFAEVDAAVRTASDRGLDVLLEVSRAPGWAEGLARPADAPAGTWRPDPEAYGQFARALARRYSGAFSPGLAQPALPKVGRYQAWNEPNLTTYLSPQGDGGAPESARIYRALLTSFYAGVKSVDPGNLVVSAGTSPYGGTTQGGRPRSHPVEFVRELLCLNGGSLAEAGCDGPVPLDVLAHHPINAGRPFDSAENPADATTPDIGRIRNVLRDAERKGRVSAGSHPIWVTEFWWESNPPDDVYGVPEKTQARYISEALYLFWKQRVPVVLGLQLADAPIDGADPGSTFQTGLFFADGTPKDSLTAWRFPLVAVRGERASKVWGVAPATGRLALEVRRKARWRSAGRVRVRAGKVFRDSVPGRGRVKVRARVGSERSLPYKAAER